MIKYPNTSHCHGHDFKLTLNDFKLDELLLSLRMLVGRVRFFSVL